VLWGRKPEFMAALAQARSNNRFLPGIPFPPALQISSDLSTVCTQSNDLLLAVASHGFRDTLQQLRSHFTPRHQFAWASKGLEPHSGKFLHEVVAEVLGATQPMAIVSGPTFAQEVARGSPTAVTLASTSSAYGQHWVNRLHSESFRVYTSDDIPGVELGGAIKNVLAIAAGIADALGFGANTRAALISRGLAEMMRLGVSVGGQRETFMGLAGLGDLVLTCTDDLSRNRRLGLALARGESLQAALTTIGQVVEGVPTAREVMRLATAQGIEMPISEQVYCVLHEGKSPRAAVQALLAREQKAE
jgi:glycerol-3-phosphate dehydrogenase (NAD(P)+)